MAFRLLCCTAIALVSLPHSGADRSDAPTDRPPNTPATSSIEEVEVTGEHPGPGLWRITHGDHVLWLLGTIDPLPRKMEWKSREVESVISEAQELLYEQPSVSVHGNPITWNPRLFRLAARSDHSRR